MIRKLYFTFFLAAIAAVFMTAVPAFADTLDFSLTSTAAEGLPGSTVEFFATVSAPTTNTGSIFLNGASDNIGGGLVLDDSPFYSNFPFSLDAGQSYTGLLFTVGIPVGTPIDSISTGSFEILGGSDGNAQDVIASSDFQVTAAPEPSSILLLGSGLLVIAGTVRRKLMV